MATNPHLGPDMGGFMIPGSQADIMGSPVAALGAAGAFGGPLVGFDSVNSSSSSNNLVSGSGYAFPAAGGGLLTPESSYLVEAAAYAHDGLDVPGTAQVGLLVWR